MIRIDVYLESPAAILAVGSFGAGALIRIESSADLGGPYVEVGTKAVDTTTVQPFVFWDPAGTSATWYRWRISDAGNSSHSGYSDPRHGTSPTDTVPAGSYADLGDLLPRFETAPLPARYGRLTELLRDATAELIAEMGGRDYFRHPATGSGTWYGGPDRVSPRRGRRDYDIIHVHEGLLSLDQLEVSQDLGGSFSTVTSSDYALRGSDPDSASPLPEGEPYFHIVFTGLGSVVSAPVGVNTIRFTGARGWPGIPAPVREGIAQRARQLAYADPSFAGSVQGPPEYGVATLPERWPQILWHWLESERHRFFCHV